MVNCPVESRYISAVLRIQPNLLFELGSEKPELEFTEFKHDRRSNLSKCWCGRTTQIRKDPNRPKQNRYTAGKQRGLLVAEPLDHEAAVPSDPELLNYVIQGFVGKSLEASSHCWWQEIVKVGRQAQM